MWWCHKFASPWPKFMAKYNINILLLKGGDLSHFNKEIKNESGVSHDQVNCHSNGWTQCQVLLEKFLQVLPYDTDWRFFGGIHVEEHVVTLSLKSQYYTSLSGMVESGIIELIMLQSWYIFVCEKFKVDSDTVSEYRAQTILKLNKVNWKERRPPSFL